MKVLRFRFAIGASFQVVDIIPQSWFREWPEFRGAVQACTVSMSLESSRSEKIIQFWKSKRKEIGVSLGLVLFIVFAVWKIKLTGDMIKNHKDILQTLFFAFPVLAGIASAVIVIVNVPMWIWEQFVKKKKARAELLAGIAKLENQISELRKYESFTMKVKKIILTAQVERRAGIKGSNKLSIDAITKLMEDETGKLEIEKLEIGPIRVVFPNQTYIHEPTGADTLIQVIDTVGIETVYNLQIGTNERPLISKSVKSPRLHYRSSKSGEYYILVGSGTQTKIDQIREIGERLNIPLIVKNMR